MVSTGKLAKLTIKGFTDSEFSKKSNPEEFVTLLNPESIKLAYTTEYNKDQADGTISAEPAFKRVVPPTLSFQILFDGTGVIPSSETFGSGSNAPVNDLINKFKDVIYQYDGTIHQPNHVIVNWGVILFKGVVDTIDYDYKLFNKNGDPLRVVANVKLTGSIEEKLRAAIQNNQSPDLTHSRQVVEGDTLPRMCHKIYGDSKYYLEVAKANNITNFRKLTPGQRINFPPIEKISR